MLSRGENRGVFRLPLMGFPIPTDHPLSANHKGHILGGTSLNATSEGPQRDLLQWLDGECTVRVQCFTLFRRAEPPSSPGTKGVHSILPGRRFDDVVVSRGNSSKPVCSFLGTCPTLDVLGLFYCCLCSRCRANCAYHVFCSAFAKLYWWLEPYVGLGFSLFFCRSSICSSK